MGKFHKGQGTSSVMKKRWQLKPTKKMSDEEFLADAQKRFKESRKNVWY